MSSRAKDRGHNARGRNRVSLGEGFSEGARQLWLAMERRGWTQALLAKKLDVAQGMVSHWLWGDRLPSLDRAFVIEEKLGLDASLWRVKPKKSFQPPIVEAALAVAGAA